MKIKVLVAILFGSACLAGCQTQMRMLETSGDLRAEPSNIAGSDYVVQLRNTLDFGYNPDDDENRHKIALALLKTQCPSGRVVNEKMIATGTYGIGRQSRVYYVYVKCT